MVTVAAAFSYQRSGHAIELIPKLNERFATLDHCEDCRPRHLNDTSQARVRCVATRDQDDLRRGAVLLQQLDNGQTFDGKRGAHPAGERRWKLIVEPKRHAATIG